ncbi:MAG: response regulator transcription factor [Gemmatimonadota bacterium]|nr:response regulator transcription factor [Gemmatimonadota bacterium]
MITIAVIEDNRLVRDGLCVMLGELPDVDVVFSAANIDTERLKKERPTILLLDVGLEDENCLRLAETVQRDMSGTNVIVMDLLPAHEEVVQFVNAGVAGFILKDASLDDFIETVRAVSRGERVLPTRMTGTLFSQIARVALERGEAAAHEAVRMTQREREVIANISVGMSNKEIAQEMNIATDTVKSHVRNVMDKLALHSRLQIAAYALQRVD